MWIRCLLLLFLCPAGIGAAQDEGAGIPRQCGTTQHTGVAAPSAETGGIYLTAGGVLRILIVFASFPDDETPHPCWPAHQPPLFMNEFIDADTSVRSTGPFNLTHYFRQMSLGRFHVIGETIWTESRYSQETYRLSGSYGHANMDILPDRVDSLVDFSLYDNWTRRAEYDHVNVPDGVVDMIIMVWRTTMFEYLGEASLGYKPALLVDGKRLEMGYPAYLPLPAGSGVTCEYPYGDGPQQVMRTMAHEVGHWLLGIFHPYNGTKPDGKFQFWGMLCNGQRTSSCANAYDRERLGWITPQTLAPGSVVSLDDFVTTGAAAKYHPANGEPFEYYYLENHERRSPLDDVTRNPHDRGLWVLHQQGPYSEMDNLRIRPSDGHWEWNAVGATSCFGTSVPVFSRGEPLVAEGLSHRDQLPSAASVLNWMLAYRQPGGDVVCGEFFAGEGFRGAFDTSAASVFSPSGNPGSLTWSGAPSSFWFEVTGEKDGVITLAMPPDPITLSPARRFLGVNPAGGGSGGGLVDLAWGDQWPHGQPVESDVSSYELERAVGDGGIWGGVYSGPATTWSDASLPYDSAGTTVVRFRVRALDSQGKYSRWSNEHVATMTTNTAVDAGVLRPSMGRLIANFPNPFNPSTTIQFVIPEEGNATLEIYDLLGRRVRSLLHHRLTPGTHAVTWDGRDDQQRAAGAGVYLCRLTGKGVSASRTMLLVK
jgi:M6 family metalloprotease-like protein